MPKLNISHRTTYRYSEPIKLSAHRLMLRPSESRELTLLDHEVVISPDAELRWSTEVYGNAIATATFMEANDSLIVESNATVDLTAADWPVFDIAASAITHPFLYANHDWTDLGALVARQTLHSPSETPVETYCLSAKASLSTAWTNEDRTARGRTTRVGRIQHPSGPPVYHVPRGPTAEVTSASRLHFGHCGRSFTFLKSAVQRAETGDGRLSEGLGVHYRERCAS